MYIGICIRQSCNSNNSFILQINNCKTEYVYQVRISPYIPFYWKVDKSFKCSVRTIEYNIEYKLSKYKLRKR